MGQAFSKDGEVTQFFEHIPIVGYAVAGIQAGAHNKAEAMRAVARATNELFHTVIIAAAVAATPFEGPAAPLIWAAAGAIGNLGGDGLQAAIEATFPDDAPTEVLDRFDENLGGSIVTDLGIGAIEGVVTGGVGAIVDGAYPSMVGEMENITTVVEDQGVVVGLTEDSWRTVGLNQGRNGRLQAGRFVGRRGGIVVRPPPKRSAIAFLVRKPSNFILAYNKGLNISKEIITTKRGFLRVLMKKLGHFVVAGVATRPVKKGIAPGRGLMGEIDYPIGEIRDFFLHVQGCIGSMAGEPAVLGHMHIATTPTESFDARDPGSSYAYVTHSPTEKAPLYIPVESYIESEEEVGFYIRVSGSSGRTTKDRYLAVANEHHRDRRDKNSLYVFATDDETQRAAWVIELYEGTQAVLRLVHAGSSSGSSMVGGYLIAHFDQDSDRRSDGGCYLAVSKVPGDNNDVAAVFGIRFAHSNRLWWMDVVGEYENFHHDETPLKNDWHHVKIKESLDHQGLYWMNKAKAFWRLTPQLGSKDTLLTGNDCPYYAPPVSFNECKVLYDSKEENVVALLGPGGERYDRLWLRDFEGMTFQLDGYPTHRAEIIAVETTKNGNYDRKTIMVIKLPGKGKEWPRGAWPGKRNTYTYELSGHNWAKSNDIQSRDVFFGVFPELGNMISEARLKNPEFVAKGDSVSKFDVQRNAFGVVTSLKEREFTGEPHVWLACNCLAELYGRYVAQEYSEVKERVVSTYITIHGSPTGKEEVWWQSTNGETWSLKCLERHNLKVGETCPYQKDGYTHCAVTRDADNEVESLEGPFGRVFKRI